MTHEYNTRSNSSNRQELIMNVDALAKLEHNIVKYCTKEMELT